METLFQEGCDNFGVDMNISVVANFMELTRWSYSSGFLAMPGMSSFVAVAMYLILQHSDENNITTNKINYDNIVSFYRTDASSMKESAVLLYGLRPTFDRHVRTSKCKRWTVAPSIND